MILKRLIALAGLTAMIVPAQQSDCLYFTKAGERFRRLPSNQFTLSRLTEEVSHQLAPKTAAASTSTAPAIASSKNLIDQYIYQALQVANVQPADQTTDYEFIRRVSFDLTGQPPLPAAVAAFVADSTPTKRAKLIDSLLASPQYVDRWTMYFGDLFQNTQAVVSTGVTRYAQGRDAFYNYIKQNLVTNKPYDQIARELIAVQGTDSWDNGQAMINWIVGGRVGNGPAQDIYDAQTVNVATTFLGVSHMNCLLCHNGNGHLNTLSYWGGHTSRYQAWQMSAFLAKTSEGITRPDPQNSPNLYYWWVTDNPKASDYQLNTTTGNRPARQPNYPGAATTVPPVYIFNGDTPSTGENYRVALAREVTSDPLFAITAVNRIWAQFFGQGIVDPVDQIDPARLDPNNIPSDCADPTPCTVQPSNPYLLKALATDFANNGYDVQRLIRMIVNSETYQLSSRYNGTWNVAWQPLFARKMVRRLWAEEISDAIALTSNVPIQYTIPGESTKVNWAMQLPEPITTGFLGYFLPGNRDDQPRRSDGSIQQALALMNDSTVLNRIKATGTGATASTVQQLLTQYPSDTDLINNLFMTVLSRPPASDELSAALSEMKSGTGARADKAASLMWALYNKVDFIFNY